MKTIVLTSACKGNDGESTVTRTPPPSLSAVGGGDTGGDGSNSYYFPGCRKGTNCHCEICQASIYATLDLLPSSKGSISRNSSPERTKKPANFASVFDPITPPPAKLEPTFTLSDPFLRPFRSTASQTPPAQQKPPKNRRICAGVVSWVVKLIVGFCFLWVLDLVVPKAVLRLWEPKLERIVGIVEEYGLQGECLREKIQVLEDRIGRIVGKGVVNCSSLEANWEVHQGNQMFIHWRCVMYKSIVEEVTVWGSPVQTSGLIATGYAPRSISVLSGRITEWSGGKLKSTLRTSKSSSWNLKKWSMVSVILEPETWVLEYQQKALSVGSGLFETLWDIVKWRVSIRTRELTQKLWSLFLNYSSYNSYMDDFVQPT